MGYVVRTCRESFAPFLLNAPSLTLLTSHTIVATVVAAGVAAGVAAAGTVAAAAVAAGVANIFTVSSAVASKLTALSTLMCRTKRRD